MEYASFITASGKSIVFPLRSKAEFREVLVGLKAESRLPFGISVLETANNQRPSYERVMQELVRLIQCVAPGQVARVSDPER
jgi:hypothetical protein